MESPADKESDPEIKRESAAIESPGWIESGMMTGNFTEEVVSEMIKVSGEEGLIVSCPCNKDGFIRNNEKKMSREHPIFVNIFVNNLCGKVVD